MRKFLIAVVGCLIPIAVFVAVRRLHIPQGGQCFIIFLVVGALLVWVAKQEAISDRLNFQNTAALFGFRPADRDEVTLAVYPLRVTGWVEGAATGELSGLQAWLFNYGISDNGGNRKAIKQTVVAFDVKDANLPIFQIRPLDLGTLPGDWETRDESVCFPDALHFHKRFELLSSAEEGVRRHFNAKLLDAIAALNDWNYLVQGLLHDCPLLRLWPRTETAGTNGSTRAQRRRHRLSHFFYGEACDDSRRDQ